jgi:NAD(P)H-hydrate epimerase
MQLPTQLLRRKSNVHKGDFGHIFVLAGSARFSGAAALCSGATLRAGAGLVTLGIPGSLNQAIIKIKLKEVMTLPLPETKQGSLNLSGYQKIKDFLKDIDMLVIGPGLGQESSTQKLIRKLIRETDKPLVIDADGLNALVGHLKSLTPKTQHPKPIILTPHPGEMARLLGISVAKVQSKRKEIAKKFAQKYRVTVVLKGHNTVVADYKDRAYINKTGNPGMSTAGSGDVLTGMIAAFLGQGLDAFNAAKYAVYLHGLAGDLAAGEKTQISLIASDIIDKIPEAIKKIR